MIYSYTIEIICGDINCLIDDIDSSKHTHIYIYSLDFPDDRVLLAQDHDDKQYMAGKLKEGY
jgi:hypothetical protein